ncbi:serine/threonine protein kinase [Butyrivibrio sp. WCD2001]|uniref:serine/threonine protein kinase n=1 Tax=Butyrivibrio sp. WCD2001 TaxID=1280681 RepID=UPI000407B34C|nr:serine/threonine-protein kinase [Butyrivibrio sp. WCD2001]
MDIDISHICPNCLKTKGEAVTCPHCGYKYDANNITNMHALKPYTILQGKYLVGNILGEGGFGITYIGFDLNLETRIAIKEFYPNGFVTRESAVTTMVTNYTSSDASQYEKWKDSFVREAKSLAKFANLPGIVHVHDFFQENNTAYIVMEYVEGETLKEHLKKCGGKMPVAETLAMMKPVIESLAKVHEAQIIHRDISPDNIMIQEGGTVRLIDFGAARDFSNDDRSLSVLLKPGFAPEEQYRSKGNQGPWTDVYAICATIYRCITGEKPPESMERIRQDSLKSPSSLGVKILPFEEAALLSGLSVFAENRIKSMKELENRLYNGQDVDVIQKSNNDFSSSLWESSPEHVSGFDNTTEHRTNIDIAGIKIPIGILKWGAIAVGALLVIIIALITVFSNKDEQLVELESPIDSSNVTTSNDSSNESSSDSKRTEEQELDGKEPESELETEPEAESLSASEYLSDQLSEQQASPATGPASEMSVAEGPSSDGANSSNDDVNSEIADTNSTVSHEKDFLEYAKSFTYLNGQTEYFTSQLKVDNFYRDFSRVHFGAIDCFIDDFDSDGEDELLIAGITQNQIITFTMYEYDNGVKMTDQYEYSMGTPYGVDGILYGDKGLTTAFLYNFDNRKCIGVVTNDYHYLTEDGLTLAFSSITYDGSMFVIKGHTEWAGTIYDEDTNFVKTFQSCGIQVNWNTILSNNANDQIINITQGIRLFDIKTYVMENSSNYERLEGYIMFNGYSANNFTYTDDSTMKTVIR